MLSLVSAVASILESGLDEIRDTNSNLTVATELLMENMTIFISHMFLVCKISQRNSGYIARLQMFL